MTAKKPALSSRLNQFWAKMLAPINAYLGSALIIIALGMALVGLSGGHMGGHVDISVMRDGGDVSVRVQEGQMPEGVMREDMGKKSGEYRSGHPDWRHHGWHLGYGHHGGYAGGRGAGLFGLVLALGLAAMVGLVARLIQIAVRQLSRDIEADEIALRQARMVRDIILLRNTTDLEKSEIEELLENTEAEPQYEDENNIGGGGKPGAGLQNRTQNKRKRWGKLWSWIFWFRKK